MKLAPGDRVIAGFAALVVVLFGTHADMLLATLGHLPLGQPTRLFLACMLPLLALWTAAQLRRREVLLGPFGALRDNRLPLTAVALLTLVSLVPGALLPGAHWTDGATEILLLPYALVVFASALMLGGSRAVGATWRPILAATWLVAVTSIIIEIFQPAFFASLVPPGVRWATAPERAAGVMGDANTAAFIVTTLAALLLRYDRLRRGDLALLALTGLAVLATQSRGGLLLMVMLAGAYLLATRSALRGPGLALTVTSALGTLALLVVVVFPALSTLPGFSDWESQRRLEMLTFERSMVPEDESRLSLVANYLALIEQHPLAGHGTGFMRSQNIGTHNIYLRHWLDNGLPALLAYLALLGSAAFLFWRRRFCGGVVFVAIAAAHGMFSHTLLESRGFLLLLGIALAVSPQAGLAAHGGPSVGEERPQPPARFQMSGKTRTASATLAASEMTNGRTPEASATSGPNSTASQPAPSAKMASVPRANAARVESRVRQ